MSRRPVLASAAVVAALLAGCDGGDHAKPQPTPATPPAPGPIIGDETQPPLTAAQRRAAAAAARQFLAGYLPYLYGRASASRVGPVTPSVARTLRSGSARVTPAQRRRHPRVASLRVTGQTADSALALVQIADGGPAPYQLTLTVERRGGKWVVSDLGDDG